MQPTVETFYERVGGHPTFRRLMADFFSRVREQPELAAMYPADDWEGAENRLLMFFEQYWGGPMAYSGTRGAPMLKMRHMPFKVTERMAGVWADCMNLSIASLDLDEEDDFLMRDYVERACRYLINADE